MTNKTIVFHGLVLLACLLNGVAFADNRMTVPLTNMDVKVLLLQSDNSRQTARFEVSASQSLIIDIASGDVRPEIVVRNPAGQVMDAAQIVRETIPETDVPPLGAVLYSAGEHAKLTIENPATGEWQVEVSAPGITRDVPIRITRFLAGGVSSKLVTSRYEFRTDATVVLSAIVLRAGAPVHGAEVVVDFFLHGHGQSPIRTVELRDDGAGHDAEAGDGLYSAGVDGLPIGHYLANATITGPSGDARAFTRFNVIEVFASFTGEVHDAGIDSNGDGLYEEIGIDFPVVVIKQATYALTVHLEQGDQYLLTGIQTELSPQSDKISIKIPTKEIKSVFNSDGPYEIAKVQLVKRAQGDESADTHTHYLTHLGQTKPYRLNEFQRPITIIPDGLTEAAEDTNGDGLFDRLVATFTIDTLKAGAYTWTGAIRATDGTTLDVASGRQYLPVGKNDVSFVFDGYEIGSKGIDGPYAVANVGAYSDNGGAAVRDRVGNTKPYTATQFEGGVPTFDLLRKEVSLLVITGIGGVPVADGIRASLNAKLDAAIKLYNSGKKAEAVKQLIDAFVKEINAQRGKHLQPEAADRLIMLSQQVASTL